MNEEVRERFSNHISVLLVGNSNCIDALHDVKRASEDVHPQLVEFFELLLVNSYDTRNRLLSLKERVANQTITYEEVMSELYPLRERAKEQLDVINQVSEMTR